MPKGERKNKNEHVIAVKLTDEQYSVLRRVWAQQIVYGDIAADGRAGPGTLVQEAVLCLLGIVSAPDNPLINGEARQAGFAEAV